MIDNLNFIWRVPHVRLGDEFYNFKPVIFYYKDRTSRFYVGVNNMSSMLLMPIANNPVFYYEIFLQPRMGFDDE